uniref:Phosphoinositide 3-kinase adapter protein 1 n=1 Tax=Lygus hesperus TaxID=30085 RepID=A0A0A9VYH6_LYGHE
MEALDNPSYFRLEGDPQEWISGAPRARDMAPEERKWHRRWSTKSDSAGERVVLGTSSARFINHTAPTPANRRHSSYTSTLTKRSQSVVAAKNNPGMLDITIVSSKDSEAAHLWVNYLTSCFQQISKDEHKPPFKLAKVNAEDVLMGMSVEGSCGSRLQIVIVCPVFLDALASSPGAPILASMLQPASVLAMLLGVSQQTLEAHHLSNLFRFEQWRKQTVKDQDATFVGDFLGVAMDILSRTWQMQQAIAQMNKAQDSNRAQFSITPKKIKVGQNKLLILLNDPVSAHDKITISVDKNGTNIEVPVIKRRNPYTLQFSMPSSCLQTSIIVSVNVERNGRSLGQKLVKCESKLRELDQLLRSTDNPLVFMCQSLGITNGDKDQLDNFLVAAFKKNMPPNFNLLNTHPVKQLQSKEEYPTLLHFAAKYGLEKLCWQLIESPGGELACQMQNCNHHNPAEIALHAGHTKLANALQGYLKIWHQMTELTSMYTYLKEVTEKPQDFGEGNYLLPRPINDTYLIPPKARPVVPTSLPLGLQETYQSPGSPKDFFADHLPPKDLTGFALPPSTTKEAFQLPPSPTEDYQMPMTPKELYQPTSPLENYQSPPHARPFTPMTPSTPSSPLDGPKFSTAYLHMHSPASETGSGHFDHILGPEKKYSSAHPSNENLSIASSSGHHYMNTSCSASTCSKSPQDELLEIINDFKNNVFTIAEVEKLVENWRNRNDVQQSFREKQEQLNRMRHEYEKIQQQMKDQLKRATPFDRIKKFFSRKHKHEGCPKSRSTSESVCHRPVSSLSVHSSCSSSSSGRMSTASGTSLGDSGTHSDPDEKKSEITGAEKSSPTHSHGPDFTFHDVRLQSVQENEAITCCHDEYVNASPERLPLALPPKRLGFPPPLVEKTVVQVHRSDVKSESDDKCDVQSEKVSGKVENVVGIKEVNNNGLATLATMESDDEMDILEHSEKLLKTIAEALPSYEQDDVLSPTETEFTQNGTFIDEAKEVLDLSELETKDFELSFDRDDVDNTAETKETEESDEKEESSNEEEPLLKSSTSSTPTERMEKEFDSSYYMNVDHTASNAKEYVELPQGENLPVSQESTASRFQESFSKIQAAFSKMQESSCKKQEIFCKSQESLCKNQESSFMGQASFSKSQEFFSKSQESSSKSQESSFKNQDSSQESSCRIQESFIKTQETVCKSQEYMNIGAQVPDLREYVNVSLYPTPPLPPKCKNKNVLL